MNYSTLMFIIVIIASILFPIVLKTYYRFLLSIALIFIGASIVTAIFHSDMERARMIIVGLNSIGILTYYVRYRVIGNSK
jgi:hypothetical protein